MFYLESVVYFIMSASVQKPTETGDIETNIVNEVTNFLKLVLFNMSRLKEQLRMMNKLNSHKIVK